MKKLRILLLTALVAISGLTLKAQNEMTAEQMIPVRVIMPVNDAVKGDALTVLCNRLNQSVTLNGLGSATDEERFLIVTSINILSKNATTTIPPQFIAEVELTFYFVDNVNKLILAQETITKKGMDNTEDKAIAKAVKMVLPRDPKLKKLITLGKQKAIEFDQALEASQATEETQETQDNATEEPDVTWIFE